MVMRKAIILPIRVMLALEINNLMHHLQHNTLGRRGAIGALHLHSRSNHRHNSPNNNCPMGMPDSVKYDLIMLLNALFIIVLYAAYLNVNLYGVVYVPYRILRLMVVIMVDNLLLVMDREVFLLHCHETNN